MIYFDNAATSLPKPPIVVQAVAEALNTFGGAGRGGHPAALAASRCIFQARSSVAQLLGSAPERTVFTANATESLNIAIGGLLTPQDHVITTVLEHNSVLRPLYRLRAMGMGLSFVGIDPGGNLNYEELPQALQTNTKAVVCTHASNLVGNITDLSIVSGFCREHGLLLIVDASQSAGSYPVDADKTGIDMLCFTGHKGLLGPQGTGALCVRSGLSIPPFKVGGSGLQSFSETHTAQMPEALEAGTLNAHGIAGLQKGVEYILQTGVEKIHSREMDLARKFREGIGDIPGLRFYGDPTRPHTAIVTWNLGDRDSALIGECLASQYDICVRTGAHCAPLAHLALGTKEQGAVRFSFSYFNTEDEIDKGIQAVQAMAKEWGYT